VTRNEESPSEVHLRNVSGGIHGSIIAGRDVTNATITLSGQPTPADKEPTVEELQQLLAEIQGELAEITAQKEALQAVSAAAPLTAQGAEANVNQAAAAMQDAVEEEKAESIQKSLAEAAALLSGILDGARSVAEKATEVGRAVQPIAEKLEPVVEKLGLAALWAAKLWLQS
jgi:molecular chaperone DnaK (HSP70)